MPSTVVLKSAGRSGQYGNPSLGLVADPVRALAGLVNPRAHKGIIVFSTPRSEFLKFRDGLLPHIQSLTIFDSPAFQPCLAVAREGKTTGALVFFGGVPADHDYRGYTRTQKQSHPSGLGGWGSQLAVVCEDDHEQDARLLIYENPAGNDDVAPSDQLIFDGSHGIPRGPGKHSRAAWLAWTRLANGQFLGLIGGTSFGTEHGWAITYEPDKPPGARFALLAAYGGGPSDPSIEVHGEALGRVNNASFLVGSDNRLYVVFIETDKGRLGYGRLKLYAVEAGTAPCAIVLCFLKEVVVRSEGVTSFRYGSCVTARMDGGLTAYCSERGVGDRTKICQVRGVAPS